VRDAVHGCRQVGHHGECVLTELVVVKSGEGRRRTLVEQGRNTVRVQIPKQALQVLSCSPEPAAVHSFQPIQLIDDQTAPLWKGLKNEEDVVEVLLSFDRVSAILVNAGVKLTPLCRSEADPPQPVFPMIPARLLSLSR
jgi:hypothetical protein